MEITYDMWQNHTEDVLWELTLRSGLNGIDELDPHLVAGVHMKMAELWINYKIKLGEILPIDYGEILHIDYKK